MSAQPTPSVEPGPFQFLVVPGEGDHLREARWDQDMAVLQSRGLTILGTGPDLDWPLRYELLDESNPAGSFYEIYDVVPLPSEETL